ncbi:hypothetical protein GYA27_00790 [candidate division WWE3 bacterium]|uniref:Glycosyltransferase RgtA/B/C/D-like domain-containing protein n=1 Tax=candidate division WWE3 bacterium TaxID=2053526 RepID=A0A7X9HGW0_UNCKA|nr:hypothetical protein [candidate division WWE3 bacterium]
MKRFLPVCLLILVYLTWTALTYRNYAITSDEFSSYISGQIWFEYFQNKQITYNLARYHPLVNEHYRIYPMILYILIGNIKYELFHLLNMLAFIPVIITAWILALKNNKKIYATLIPVLFILLTPRILGDIPNNPKDMPFAISYFLTLAVIYITKSTQETWKNNLKILVLGLLMGFSQSLRPLGFGLYIIYFFWNFPKDLKSKAEIGKLITESIIIFLIGLLTMAVTWPAIGANFAANLKKYLSLGVDFNLWEGTVLYFGKEFSAGMIPWHYLFVWLGITLPLSHLIFFFSGIYSIIKKRASNIQIYLYFTIGLNLLLHLILKPNLYNGIRHYDYLVLLISFAAGISLVNFYKTLNKKYFWGITTVLILYTGLTLNNISKLFPYQNLYFNEIVHGIKGAQNKFDVDYWDVAYKDAANYLAANTSTNEVLAVYSCGAHTAMDYYLGQRIDQKKNASEAQYLICDPKGYERLKNGFNILTKIEKDKTPLVVIGRR